jgi:hypothetical protein
MISIALAPVWGSILRRCECFGVIPGFSGMDDAKHKLCSGSGGTE